MKKVRKIVVLAVALACLTSASAQAASSVAISEKNANKVVTVKVGSKVSLTLHSMYWSVASLAKYGPLVTGAAVVKKPTATGANAPEGCKTAGSGCGTQKWTFIADKVGTTTLRAMRTTCGEAMKCSDADSRFEVTVKVVK
ncbi:MAG: hypothetical protein WDO06_01190 [Actinomycetota bacterium]